MSDNTTTNPGTGGDTIGSDDIAGIKYQRVKLIHGADGVNDGDVASANPLPVEDTQLADVATETTLSAINGKITAVDTGAVVISSGSVTADTELTTADLDTGAGTDTRAVVGLVGSKSGGGALIPGDATAGLKVDLGADNDVTVTNATAANLKAEVTGATSGSGTATGAIRVELPTNGTGVVGLNAGTNAIGKLAANSGVDIGDVDVTSITPGTTASSLGKAEDAGHTTADVGVMTLAVRDDSPDTARADTDNDYIPLSTSSTGAIRTAPISEDFAALANGPQTKKYYTNAGAVTDGIIWSPAAGKRWYVTDLIINTSAAATVTLEDDKAGGDEVVMKFELAANSGVQHSFLTPLFSGEDAADLMVTTSAGNIYITVVGYEI